MNSCNVCVQCVFCQCSLIAVCRKLLPSEKYHWIRLDSFSSYKKLPVRRGRLEAEWGIKGLKVSWKRFIWFLAGPVMWMAGVKRLGWMIVVVASAKWRLKGILRNVSCVWGWGWSIGGVGSEGTVEEGFVSERGREQNSKQRGKQKKEN